MKTLLLAAGATLALIGAASAETRNVSGFDQVTASGRFEVVITVGDAYSVDVSGPDAERVRTTVEGDTLEVETRNRPWIGGEPRINATVRITTPRLEGVAAARGAELTATGIAADDFSITAAMGGEARASGTCRTLDATAAMGGSVEARDLVCGDADATAAMGGSVEIFANGSLDASASMGGSIDVSGEPTRRDVSTSMGGSVSLR